MKGKKVTVTSQTFSDGTILGLRREQSFIVKRRELILFSTKNKEESFYEFFECLLITAMSTEPIFLLVNVA